MTADNRPLSEIYAEKGEEWALAEKHASILEGTKSAFLSQMILKIQAKDSTVAHNRADALAKASVEWTERVHQEIEARYKANHLRVKLESIRMGFQEWQSEEANQRVQARL